MTGSLLPARSCAVAHVRAHCLVRSLRSIKFHAAKTAASACVAADLRCPAPALTTHGLQGEVRAPARKTLNQMEHEAGAQALLERNNERF